jgi:Neprosin
VVRRATQRKVLMSRVRFPAGSRVVVVAVVAFPSGCTITVGPFDERDPRGSREPSVLPAPSQGEDPPLDDAEQARKDEVDRHIARVVYRGVPIVQTFRLPNGDVVDVLDRAWLPVIPYALPPLPGTLGESGLPLGGELGLADVEQFPELAALATVAAPFYRPTFWPYLLGETDATSIEDYLDRYQVGGAPAGADRLYAGLRSNEENRGVSALINQFRPEVAPDSFSLIEVTVACPAEGAAQEQIGVVISVDKVNGFGRNGSALADGEPRLHIEYARLRDGKVKYVWDELDGQFVPNPFRRYRPGQVVPVSEPGGTQVEHPVTIFQTPTGDWWIAYQHDLLGYYPAHLFTQLNGKACVSAWYSEALRRYPSQGAVKTEMGSGRFPGAGPSHVAYVRNPLYYDLLWFGVEPSDDEGLWMDPYEPTCYKRAAMENRVIFLGGPGGKDPGCRWPSP